MTTKKIKPELDVVDFNNKTLEIIGDCNEEINYKIIDFCDFTKNVQRMLIQNNPKYKNLEKLLLEQTYKKIPDIIPFVSSLDIFNKLSSIINFEPISGDVFLIISQLKSINFQLSLTFVRMIFDSICGRNISDFYRKVSSIFDNSNESWFDIESKYGNNVVFFLLNLLINSSNDFVIYLSENDIFTKLNSLKGIYCIHWRRICFTSDGIKNLQQQILHTNEEVLLEDINFINSDVPKSEYQLYGYLVFDARAKKVKLDDICISKSNFPLLFHQPTINFLNERKHNYIYNNLYTFLNTFNIFLLSKIRPIDRIRYLLAGSVIKSAYNVRDCADVDFFVLDHEDNIEKYTNYGPNVGIKGIFDDFGKTYYGNEEFYFPMIPEMYERQKEFKSKQLDEVLIKDIKCILNNYPKYSVSGLKAGRYIDIFSDECRKIGFKFDNLDELVFNPDFHIYFLGCPIIQLKIEMVRDNIKDIDLGRISRKQLHDMHFLRYNYEYLFSRNEINDSGLDRFSRDTRDSIKKNKIKLDINIYNKPLISDTKVGFDLVIRRIPLYIQDMVYNLIKEGPLLISTDNEVIYGDSRLVYQKPLLSSLPQSLDGKDVIYYYELSDLGEMKIYVGDEVSFYERVCITGNIRVEIVDNTKKISINISGNKMKKIYSQISNIDKRKEYKMILIIFMRNLIQLHKMVDCHTREKISVDILK